MSIIETPQADETSWPDPNLDGIHTLTYQNNDYLRRIHWWVRLFGILWIVVPAIAGLAFVAFFVAMAAIGATAQP